MKALDREEEKNRMKEIRDRQRRTGESREGQSDTAIRGNSHFADYCHA